MKPRLYADFHNLDDENRVRLDCVGTRQDLSRLGVDLVPGMALTLYTDDADEDGRPDDLEVDGVAHLGADQLTWVAEVDWASVRHASDAANRPETNGHLFPAGSERERAGSG